MREWMAKHRFELHVIAFALIVLPSAGVYPAAQAGEAGWIGPLLSLVILGNIIALLV